MVISDRRRYALVLAVIAFLILAAGIWLKPAHPPKGKRAEDLTVTRAELENLQQLVRRNSLRSLSTSFASIAADAASHTTMVQPFSVNGINLPGIGLLTAKNLDTLPRELTAAQASDPQLITPTLWVPGLPFFVASIDGTITLSPASAAQSAPVQGGWMLVVATGASGQTLVSPGLYDGVVTASCGPFIHHRLQITVPLNQTYLGGGLFDLSGDLHGVVLPCDDGPAVIPLGEIQSALSLVRSDTGLLLARYGLRLAFNSTSQAGATVLEVWDDWPADEAGINPGDEIVAVDNQETPSAAKVTAALLVPQAGGHEITWRNNDRRAVTGTLVPVSIDTVRRSRPALLTENQPGVVVARVPRGSSADRAGIRPGDRILSINGRLATKTLAQQTFAQFQVPEPVSVVVQRPGRRVQIVVQP